MRWPLVGLASALVAAFGGYALIWYENLSKDEKDEADRLAEDYAKRLYGVTLDKLTFNQLKRVQSLVKNQIAA